jgi:diadenosine tetraphosphate (Ap4A) HIT family hydrolase
LFHASPNLLVSADRIWLENEHAIAFAAETPATLGHVLIVPRRHVATIYELTAPEQKAMWALVAEAPESSFRYRL